MTNQSEFAEVAVNPRTRLYEDFNLALHAMAQPLTVLLGTLGALSLRGPSPPDANRYLQMSYKEVERLCGLMASMRGLLDRAQFDAVVAPTDLNQLIDSIPDREDSASYQFALHASATEADRGIQVLADPDRAVEAVRAVLRALSGHSYAGERIELSIDSSDGFAVLTLRPVNAQIKRLSSIDRLHLSLAEESIRSQEGIFEYLEQPISISIKLPIVKQEALLT
jgi:hypothetical protein